MQNVIEWHRNAIDCMHAYQWPQQHGHGGRVDRVEQGQVEQVEWLMERVDQVDRVADQVADQVADPLPLDRWGRTPKRSRICGRNNEG